MLLIEKNLIVIKYWSGGQEREGAKEDQLVISLLHNRLIQDQCQMIQLREKNMLKAVNLLMSSLSRKIR